MHVPERRVTNKDLEALMDTTDEWIRQRSGIVERRWVREGETPADLAEKAARQAIESAGIEPEDIDCIVLATLSAQADFPGTSFFLQERLSNNHSCGCASSSGWGCGHTSPRPHSNRPDNANPDWNRSHRNNRFRRCSSR
jgi:3-oxoacyl-[acyl-carrier-protein] synthase III